MTWHHMHIYISVRHLIPAIARFRDVHRYAIATITITRIRSIKRSTRNASERSFSGFTHTKISSRMRRQLPKPTPIRQHKIYTLAQLGMIRRSTAQPKSENLPRPIRHVQVHAEHTGHRREINSTRIQPTHKTHLLARSLGHVTKETQQVSAHLLPTKHNPSFAAQKVLLVTAPHRVTAYQASPFPEPSPVSRKNRHRTDTPKECRKLCSSDVDSTHAVDAFQGPEGPSDVDGSSRIRFVFDHP